MEVGEDYSEYLVKQSRSRGSIFHEFILLYSSEEQKVHLFFEGEHDTLFYTPFVRQRAAGRKIHTYICDGKDGVQEALQDIAAAGYSAVGCLFFVDRDHDDFFGCQIPELQPVFITDGYSVENYLVSSAAVDIILEDFVGLSVSDPEHKKVSDAYDRWMNTCGRELRRLMAWSLAYREAGPRARFSNVKIKNVLEISSDGNVRLRKDGFKIYRSSCGRDDIVPKIGRVRYWLNALEASSFLSWARGKFVLWAFETFLILTVESSVKEAKARGKKRVRTPTSLSQRRLFDMLGGRLAPPPRLQTFLDANLVFEQRSSVLPA